MIASVLPVLGCNAKEAGEELSLARVYAAYHVALEKMGHAVQWPDVIELRKILSREWMQKTIQLASSTPITGVANLD